MGQYEEGDEDDSDSVDDDNFEEFADEDEAANIPLINMVNSNYQQLKKDDVFLIENGYQVPNLRPERLG
jgi:hypothetical protein